MQLSVNVDQIAELIESTGLHQVGADVRSGKSDPMRALEFGSKCGIISAEHRQTLAAALETLGGRRRDIDDIRQIVERGRK